MLRRILATCLVFIGSTSVSFAGAYLAASLAFINVFISGRPVNSYNGLAPKFAAGYGDFPIGSVYFAGEVFAMPFKPATTHNTSSFNGTLKIDWSYGASLLAGINLDGAVRLYGRLGYVVSHFQSFNTANGGQGGLGLEAKFYGNWSARAELIRTQYTSGIVNGSKPKVDEGDIGVVYRFWC